jgi:hypothetical protein
MDMQVRGGVDEGMPTQTSELTYSWLYQQVQMWANQSIYPKPSRVEKWSFRLGLLAAGVGLLAAAAPSSGTGCRNHVDLPAHRNWRISRRRTTHCQARVAAVRQTSTVSC